MCICKVTFNFEKVRIVVSDFQPQGQPGLTQKLQQVNFMHVCSQYYPFLFKVVKDLAEIDKLRPSVADIQVPMTFLLMQFNFKLSGSSGSV